MADRKRRISFNPFGVSGSQDPGDDCAPIVANQLDLVDGQRVEDPDQVCDQAGQRIIAGSSRHIAVPATAGVGAL